MAMKNKGKKMEEEEPMGEEKTDEDTEETSEEDSEEEEW